MAIVELSTGHVFERGSVKGIGPLDSDYLFAVWFDVIGVGFREKVNIRIPQNVRHAPQVERIEGEHSTIQYNRQELANRVQIDAWAKVQRQEFVDLLLGDDK